PFEEVPEAAPARLQGPQFCKFHPKSPGRHQCPQCGNAFCDLCVTTRPVAGSAKKFCRHCGVECSLVQVHIARPVAGSNQFFSKLAGAFLYPLRGSGIAVLFVATIVFSALNFISGGFAIFATIIALGYLFSFMQTIIHSTAAEESEMPGLPGLDDVFGGFFRLVSASVFSFGPAIGLGIYALVQDEPAAGVAMVAAMVFGCIYFPMALLAVAIKDASLAANPLIVVPSIFKVPLQYLVAVVLLGMVFGLKTVGDMVIPMIFPKGLTTKSMAEMAALLATQAFWSFVGIYLLAINMRILGLLYVANRQRLGWIGH
ncbi:MAG TPA: hypothetical protein VN673_06390, partial [Clostridia bacterium]|nr:hypothetical protein [Clostridia bacterium]